MNIIDKTVNDLRDRMCAYIDSENGKKLEKVNSIVNDTGLGINTIYAFRRGRKENANFQTGVLSKICDFLDKEGV